MFDVKAYGALGDGSTDDTTAIQSAMTAALAAKVSMPDVYRGVPTVYFPAGAYIYSSQLTWEGVHLQGDTSGQGSVLVWKGTGGSTTIVRTETTGGDGGTAWAYIRDLAFVTLDADTSNFPACYVDYSTGSGAYSLDFGARLDNVWFKNWTATAAKMTGVICANWTQLRFTNNSTTGNCYAVTYTVRAGESNHEFSLDGFEIDYGASCSPDGLFLLDGTSANASPGVIGLSNGHIELNATMSGNKAVIVDTTSSTNNRNPAFMLRNVAVQGSTGISLIACPSTNGTACRPVVTLVNTQLTTFAALINGAGLQSGYPVPALPAGNIQFASVSKNAATIVAADTGSTYGGISTMVASGKQTYQVYLAGESAPRFEINENGKHQWGDGTNARDTNLYRYGADKLRTDDMLMTTLGLGIGNYATATTKVNSLVKKFQIFDDTGASLGYVPIYSTIT